MNSSAAALEIENLAVSFGAIKALRGISLTVSSGEVVALLGSNGAGKTTTLRAISGLTKASSGSIRFNGESTADLSPEKIVKLGISQSPEGRRLFSGLSVADNLRLGASTRTDRIKVAEDLEKMFALFPIIKQRMSQLAGTLSGGEQQQVALARALMAAPKLLLLDEPSLGVAPLLVRLIFEALGELKKQGVTMLLVEQNTSLALQLADRAYVLRNGQIVLTDAASELRTGERVAQAYLGAGQ